MDGVKATSGADCAQVSTMPRSVMATTTIVTMRPRTGRSEAGSDKGHGRSAPLHLLDPISAELTELLGTVEHRLTRCGAARDRLIDSVRAVRLALDPTGEARPTAPVPHYDPTVIAPLELPDRITRRDYNYFNNLNSALRELAAREQHRAP